MVLCGTWSETSVAQSQLTQFWQIPRHRTLSYSLWTPFFASNDYPLAVEPGSTPRPLVQKKFGEILYLLICSFLPCLSWLLRSRVRKSRRDLRITLHINKQWYLTHQFLTFSKAQGAELTSSESRTFCQFQKVTDCIRRWTRDENYRHGGFTLFKYGIQTGKQDNFLKRFIAQKVRTACKRKSYEIVPLTN